MLYPALWAYRTAVNTTTSFSPYQLVHGVESILPIECEIPSLKLAVERHFTFGGAFGHLEKLDEQRRDALVALEVNKCRVKV